MPDRPPIRLVVEAEAEAVRAALLSVSEALRLPADEASTVEIVLAEAMNNVVEHAYAGGPGRMTLELRAAPDGLHCRLADRGRPLPKGRMPLGGAMPAGVAAPDLPEGGFGWFLIRQLAHGLRHRRVEGRGGAENRLTFRLSVGLDRPCGEAGRA